LTVELKEKGLKEMMVSINPFYLDYIPFERTDTAVNVGFEIFGESMISLLRYQKQFDR
jgi:hypothetical protein